MQQEITIPHMGQKIHGTLYTFSKKALVIISPGWLVTRNIPSVKRKMTYLDPAGPSIFIYDSLSYVHKPILQRLVPYYPEKADELKTIVSFFVKTKKYKHIILEGISLGALLSAVITPQVKGINGLVLVNGFFDIHGYLKKYWWQNIICKLFYSKQLKANIEFFDTQLHPEKITVPTLVLHGEKDTFLDPEASRRFFNAIKSKNKTFLPIPEADHFFKKKEPFINAGQMIITWMKQQKFF